MELDHDFTVPVPVAEAWSVLLDVERVALCMPGATLDSVDGEEYSGRLKVKLGAMTITYKGTARIAAADEEAREVTIEAAGKEARGSGTASATVQAKLHEEGESTRVAVHTKLNVTGRPAQFGRNILSEVGSKLIDRFAKALSEELAADRSGSAAAPTAPAAKSESESAPDEAGSAVPRQRTAEESGQGEKAGEKASEAQATVSPLRERRSEEAIDLLEVAGPSVAKRAAPAAGVVAAVVAVGYFIRRLVRRRR